MKNMSLLWNAVRVYIEKISGGTVERRDSVKISSCAFESRNEIRLKSWRYVKFDIGNRKQIPPVEVGDMVRERTTQD
jgi:hypothetical protein